MKENRIKKYAFCLLSPIAVLLLLSVFFAAANLYPFGKLCFSWCDMDQQVLPFLTDLKNILSGDANLLLNMQNGGGMNFWGVFLFFLSSPFSFLVAFVDKADLNLFMNVLVALKMAVCALTASVFLRYKTPRLKPYLNVLLGVMYAFSGFALLFYQNVMWLDIMYLFPLLLLALERLTHGNKPFFYIAVLTLCVAVNFYMSYMLVLCVLLYMGVYLLLHKKEQGTKRTAAVFCVSSFVSCLLSAPAWLPALLQYMQSARTSNIIESITSGGLVGYIYTVWPLLFCTAAAIPAVFLALRHLKDSGSRLYLIMFAFTLLPFILEPVNKMWHTGNYMAFPARYGYMTVFFAIALLANVLDRAAMQPAPGRRAGRKYALLLLGGCALLCAGAVAVILVFYDKVQAYIKTLWGDINSFFILGAAFILLCAAYAAVLAAFQKKKLRVPAAALLLTLVLLCECMANSGVYIAAPRHNDEVFRSVMDLSDQTDKSGFYRVKTDKKRYNVNLTGAAGYNTLGHYSSLTPEDYMYTMKKLGYSAYWMEVSSSGGTLFSDALLSNRYTIGDTRLDGAFYKNGLYAIGENEFFLPPAAVTGESLAQTEKFPQAGRIEIQQYICKKLFGEQSLFRRYEPAEEKNVTVKEKSKGFSVTAQSKRNSYLLYEIPVKERTTLYFDCFDRVSPALVEKVNGAATVEVNGKTISDSYPSQMENGILPLGSFENETVTVEIKINKDFSCTSLGVYGLDENKLGRLIENAQKTDVSVENNTVAVHCTAKQGDTLLVAIPYNEGFRAQVNGTPAHITKAFGGFMAVTLGEGENDVALSFVPRGLVVSFAVCGAGLLLCIGYALYRRKKSKGFRVLNQVSYAVCIGAFSAVCIAVYIAPLLIKLFVR